MTISECTHSAITRDGNNVAVCARPLCRVPMRMREGRWEPEPMLIQHTQSAYNLAARDLAKELIEMRRQVSRCQGLLETSIRLGSVINSNEFTMLLDQVEFALKHHITKFALLPREEA